MPLLAEVAAVIETCTARARAVVRLLIDGLTQFSSVPLVSAMGTLLATGVVEYPPPYTMPVALASASSAAFSEAKAAAAEAAAASWDARDAAALLLDAVAELDAARAEAAAATADPDAFDAWVVAVEALVEALLA